MAHHQADLTANRRALLIVLALTLGFLGVEIAVGLLTNSLALLADGLHMLTDAGALALAYFAAWLVERPAPRARTYGYYRVEILAALANALLLLGSSIFIVYEAINRFDDPADISGTPMLIVAAVGLLVNVAGLLILRGRAGQNLNMAGAFAEVLKDALGSVGVIVAGLIIIFTGQTIADPIVSILIALLILPRTWSLLSESVNILLESAPQEIDVADLEQAMLAVDGVNAVHDSHVWSISSGFQVLSTHVVVKQGVDRRQAQRILAELTALAKGEFGIDHTTIQVEYEDLAEEEHPV